MKLQPYQHAWTESVSQNKRLNLETQPRFILFHNPKNWELVKHKPEGRKKSQWLLLPQLNQLMCVSGVNNVDDVGGRIDTTFATASLQKEGFTVLFPEQHNYLVSYPVTSGRRFDFVFNEYEQIGNTVIQTFNHQKYNEWKRQLIVNGTIQPPHEHFIKLMIHKVRPLIDKYSEMLHSPVGKKKYEEACERVEILEKQIELLKTKGKGIYGQRTAEQSTD